MPEQPLHNNSPLPAAADCRSALADIAPLTPPQLEQVCKVLEVAFGDLSGDELGQVLESAGLGLATQFEMKWLRLFSSLADAQRQAGTATPVLLFIRETMLPRAAQQGEETLQERLGKLNEVLSLAGVAVDRNGVARAADATNSSRAPGPSRCADTAE